MSNVTNTNLLSSRNFDTYTELSEILPESKTTNLPKSKTTDLPKSKATNKPNIPRPVKAALNNESKNVLGVEKSYHQNKHHLTLLDELDDPKTKENPSYIGGMNQSFSTDKKSSNNSVTRERRSPVIPDKSPETIDGIIGRLFEIESKPSSKFTPKSKAKSLTGEKEEQKNF